MKLICLNCKGNVSLDERRENDGDCPICGAEMDLELYLEEQQKNTIHMLVDEALKREIQDEIAAWWRKNKVNRATVNQLVAECPKLTKLLDLDK